MVFPSNLPHHWTNSFSFTSTLINGKRIYLSKLCHNIFLNLALRKTEFSRTSNFENWFLSFSAGKIWDWLCEPYLPLRASLMPFHGRHQSCLTLLFAYWVLVPPKSWWKGMQWECKRLRGCPSHYAPCLCKHPIGSRIKEVKISNFNVHSCVIHTHCRQT